MLDRVSHQLDPVVQLQLAQGVLHVVLDGAVGEVQPLSDLLVRQPLGHQAEHLGLPLGEARCIRARRRRGLGQSAELAEHQPGESGREDRVAGCYPPDRRHELLARRRLDQVPRGSCLDRIEHVGLLARGRQHQDSGRLVEGHQRGRHLDAAGGGDVQVEDDDTGPGGLGAADRLCACGSCGDDLEAFVREVASHRLAPHRVVVHDHDSDRLPAHGGDATDRVVRRSPIHAHFVSVAHRRSPGAWCRSPARWPLGNAASSARCVRRTARGGVLRHEARG